MKSKILSFVLLLCAATVFSQTIINYPLEKNLNYTYAESGTLPHTIGYGGSTTTPEFYNGFGGWLKIQKNNDYIELTFNRNGYDELGVEFEIGAWGIYTTGNFKLFWMDGANPVQIGPTASINSTIWPESEKVTRSLPAEALVDPTITIRISGSSPLSVFGVYGLRHLKINSKNTSLSVKRNLGGYDPIPYNSEASTVYDTDFGSLLTMEEHETKEFVIRNTGQKNDLKIDHFEIIQSDNDFKFEGTLPTGGTTAPNETKTFKIRFEPQDQGLKVAEIRIYANILPNNPFVFKVIGNGKSCNLTPVPIATQHFETSPQNLDYTQIGAGNLKLINGTSSSHIPASIPNLYPGGQNLYVTGATSGTHGTSWYVRGNETGEVTLEFGEADVSNQQEVSIYFEVAAFGQTNDNKSGVNSSDYVMLSLWDEANNSWSNQIRLYGSNSSTRYQYEFGKSLYTKTAITSTVTNVYNNDTNGKRYGKIEQKIPASFIPANGKLKFRIIAKTSQTNTGTWWNPSMKDYNFWLIDNVQVKAGNAIAKVWNGSSWQGGKPSEREKALFDGNYDFTSSGENSDLTICECEVNNGKNLTIPNGRTLTVRNKVINNQSNGENFVVQDGGNLIQLENSIQNEGKIKVEKWVQDMNNAGPAYDYVYWSSPVEDQNLHDFSNKTPFGHNKWGFLWYNEADDYFYNVDTNTEPNFLPGKGYAIRAEEGTGFPNPYTKTYSFIGTPNNGRVLFPLKKTQNGNGYNLIGNPYPSNIDADVLYNMNSSLLTGNFYFWTNNNPEQYQQGSGYEGNNYAVYNATGGTPATAADPATGGNWSMDAKPTGIISVGQGFIVEAKASGDLMFLNSNSSGNMLRVSTATDFFQKADKDRFWLTLTSPSQIINTTLIGYIPGAVNEYDKGFDAEFWGASDAIYSIIPETQLIIQGKEYPLDTNDIVPLGYKAFETGTYIIQVEEKEGIFAEAQRIFLVDKLLNKTVNLSAKPYKFLTRAGEFNDRFEIIYKNKNIISTVQDVVEPLLITVTRQSDDLLIMSKGDKLSEVTVYNLLGKPVFTYKDLNTEELRIPAAEYSKQILIVNIVTRSGRTASQKVIPK